MLRFSIPRVNAVDVQRAFDALLDRLGRLEIVGNFIGTPSDGDVPIYDASTKTWGPGAPSAGSPSGSATFGQATVSFSSGGGPYTATVSVSDAGVSAGSKIVPLAVAPAVGRDADEMEFCIFQTSVDSINAGVGFTLRVTDFAAGAHGDYLLNYVR